MGLTDVHISGYRSVRSIRFPMRQLTVLVGANGVGKTNLYRALELVQGAATGEMGLSIAREGGLGSVMWAGERQATDMPLLTLEVGLDHSIDDVPLAPRYRIEVGFGDSQYEAIFAHEPKVKFETLSIAQGKRRVDVLERKQIAAWYRDDTGARRHLDEPLLNTETALSALRGTLPELDSVRHLLGNWRFYHGFRSDGGSPVRRPALAVTSPLLDADGGNLAAVLATLVHIRNDTTALDQTIDDAFPGAKLIVPPPGEFATFTLRFPEFPKRQFGAHELSDGTVQFLAMAGALLSYRLPPLIALNEPENSLHPDLLPALARLIARAAGRTQVLVVTHSRILADALAEETGTIPREVIRKNGGTWLEGLSNLGQFDD